MFLSLGGDLLWDLLDVLEQLRDRRQHLVLKLLHESPLGAHHLQVKAAASLFFSSGGRRVLILDRIFLDQVQVFLPERSLQRANRLERVEAHCILGHLMVIKKKTRLTAFDVESVVVLEGELQGSALLADDVVDALHDVGHCEVHAVGLAEALAQLASQLEELALELSDWEGLAALLPELEKQKVLAPDTLHALRSKVHEQSLAAAARDSLVALRLAWQQVPKALRHDEALVLVYLEALVAHNEDLELQTLLTQQLKHEWSDNLIGALGFMRGGSAQSLLLLLENMLKQRPHNAVLMLTLGRLSLREQWWSKAREYFEHALRATRTPALRAEIAAELARLLDHMGERDESLQYYEQALGMLQHPLPDLPLPQQRR